MKVGESVRHSLEHWDRAEWDAAMLHACNAVDATGRKRYPKLGVAGRFKRIIRESLDIFGAMAMPSLNIEETRFPVAVRSDLPDERPDIADIIYGIHRCAHGHGDELPEGFELMPYVEPQAAMRIQGGTIRLSAATVPGLLAIAVFAPENLGQSVPNEDYQLRFHQHVLPVSDWWGRQDDFRDIIAPIRAASPLVTINFAHWWDSWSPPVRKQL